MKTYEINFISKYGTDTTQICGVNSNDAMQCFYSDFLPDNNLSRDDVSILVIAQVYNADDARYYGAAYEY